jgi:predicted flavoprotein YhiN
VAERRDVVIIGAGAAGMMCAIEAGRRGRRALVIDHARAPGEKIRISGGGRCNFTNIHAGPKNFLSANPHFCKSALARYTPRDFLDLVERHRIPWHEKTLGQLFCDSSAKDIIAMLLAEMKAAGAELRLSMPISAIEHDGQSFPRGDRAWNGRSVLAGHRHGRQVDPKDGRDRLCLPRCRTVRHCGYRNPRRPRAPDARSRDTCCP